MKGRKPFGSRVRKAFVIATAALGLGASTGIIESLDKNPVTDTQNVTTYHEGTSAQYGYNISPLDQMWKHTLQFRSEDQRIEDLLAAAGAGDSWRVQALIDHGINTGDEGVAALEAAIRGHHADVVGVLLEGGVSASADRSNTLIGAAILGDTRIAEMLLVRGADATAQDSMALRAAASDGNLPMVRMLVAAGADPGAMGSQALIDAASWGHAGVVEYLLTTTKTFRLSEDGFDLVRVPDAEGFSLQGSTTFTYKAVDIHAFGDAALQAAVDGGHEDVAKMLIAAGANVNVRNGEPLASAVFSGNQQLVSFMLMNGADINAGTGKALNMAVMIDDASMARLLVNSGADMSLNLQTLDMLAQSINPDMKEAVPLGPVGKIKPLSSGFGI